MQQILYVLFLKNKKEAADKKATCNTEIVFLLVVELPLVCLHLSAFGKLV